MLWALFRIPIMTMWECEMRGRVCFCKCYCARNARFLGCSVRWAWVSLLAYSAYCLLLARLLSAVWILDRGSRLSWLVVSWSGKNRLLRQMRKKGAIYCFTRSLCYASLLFSLLSCWHHLKPKLWTLIHVSRASLYILLSYFHVSAFSKFKVWGNAVYRCIQNSQHFTIYVCEFKLFHIISECDFWKLQFSKFDCHQSKRLFRNMHRI